MEVPKTGPVVHQMGAGRAEQVKKGGAEANSASTITSAKTAEDKGCLAVMTTSIVAAYTWIKETIASIFSRIASFFCESAEQVKAAQAVEQKKGLELLLERFLQHREEDQSADKHILREFWQTNYDKVLTQDQRDALIKEDIRDRVKDKPDVDATVEDRFRNKAYVDKIVYFVRDFAGVENINKDGVANGKICYAYENPYIPTYLGNLISKINQGQKVN